MSPTARQPSPAPVVTTEHRLIACERLTPNPWNPNKMTPFMRDKLVESIRQYGFVDDILVREHPSEGSFQIIDGENRYEVGKGEGMTVFPCTVISGLTDAQAEKLTIIRNELHGQADPDKLTTLLKDIAELSSIPELMVALPYDEATLVAMLDLPALPTPGLSDPPQASPGSTSEPWVERTYRMPKSVSLVIDEALEKAADGDRMERWQALERVAADYLAS